MCIYIYYINKNVFWIRLIAVNCLTALLYSHVQGFFICHIINYTGYNQKWNVYKSSFVVLCTFIWQTSESAARWLNNMTSNLYMNVDKWNPRGCQIGRKTTLDFFIIKHYKNLIKGINSVWKKGFSLEATETHRDKILPNARFFKVGLGNMSKNSYLCIFWLIFGIRYISLSYLD